MFPFLVCDKRHNSPRSTTFKLAVQSPHIISLLCRPASIFRCCAASIDITMSRDEANITPVSIKGGAPIKLGDTFMCMDWEHGATGYFDVRPALTSPMK